MLLASLRLARPGEADLVDARFLQLRRPIGRDIGRHETDVDVDQFRQQLALVRLQRLRRDAQRRQRLDVDIRHRHHVARRRGFDDRPGALWLIEGFEQRARGVFFRAENAETLLRSFAHFRGIRSEECRRPRHQRAVDDGEMQRDMMPFDAPAPGVPGGRRAEHRKEVALGIAHERRVPRRLRRPRALRGFERAQHLFQVHDGRRREIAALAQAGLDQVVREAPLRLVHFLDGEPFAREGLGWNEMPVKPLVRRKVEGGLLPLLRGQAGQKFRGGRRHGGRRPVGAGEGGEGEHRDDRGRDTQARREPVGHSHAPYPGDSSLTAVVSGRIISDSAHEPSCFCSRSNEAPPQETRPVRLM